MRRPARYPEGITSNGMGPRLLYVLIVGMVILAALALRVWDPTPVARLRSLVFDAYQRLDPRAFDPALPVRIVDIDEESLKRIGQWPWPRTVLAELVDKLVAGGAAAIGFDMVFPEPDRMSPANTLRYWPQSDALASLREEVEKLPSNDQVFAEAIGKGPVVLGFIASPDAASLPKTKAGFAHGGDDPELFAPHYPGAAASLTELQDKAQGAGSLNWIPEEDQIIRRMPMLVSVGDTLYPALSAEMLRLAQGASTYLVKSSGASGEKAFGEKTGIVAVKVGDFEVPTEANGQMWIRFTPETKQRYLPAWKVLNGEIGADELSGRILIIGTSAAGLLDLRATPLDASVPGVSLHAQAIEQILQGGFLQRPDFATPAELLFILVLGTLIAVLIYRLGAAGSAVLGGLAIAGVVGVSWYAFDVLGWLVDPDLPGHRAHRHLSRRHSVRVSPHRARAEPGPSRLLALYGAGSGRTAGRRSVAAQARRRDARHDAAVQRRARLHHHLRGARRRGAHPLPEFPVHALEQHHSRRARHHRQIHGRRGDGVLERAARRRGASEPCL